MNLVSCSMTTTEIPRSRIAKISCRVASVSCAFMPGGRLVEQQHRRVRRQRAGDLQARWSP
jgi:hypothetical protein